MRDSRYHIVLAGIAEPAPQQWQLQWDLANRNTRVCAEIYQSQDTLAAIAAGVDRYCGNVRCSYLFEAGSEDPADRSGYYLRFKLSALDAVGNSCIHVRYTNHRPLPFRQMAEFCIQTDLDSIVALNRQLLIFANDPRVPLHWCETSQG